MKACPFLCPVAGHVDMLHSQVSHNRLQKVNFPMEPVLDLQTES